MGTAIIVSVKNTKNKMDRTFIIKNPDAERDYVTICSRYIMLRPEKIPHSRFFIFYSNNKCSTQPIGKNTFSKMPQMIASFLNLEDAAEYTGHCFRRTSASLLADSGVDTDVLKRHGGWRSATVAEGYVENSVNNKKTICDQVFGSDTRKNADLQNYCKSDSTTIIATSTRASTASCTATSTITSNSSVDLNQSLNELHRLINVSNCENVNLTINISK